MRVEESNDPEYGDAELNEFNDFDYSSTEVISPQTVVAFEEEMDSFEKSSSSQQIFNQAVYDCANLLLHSLKPYGARGLPSLNFMHKHKK